MIRDYIGPATSANSRTRSNAMILCDGTSIGPELLPKTQSRAATRGQPR